MRKQVIPVIVALLAGTGVSEARQSTLHMSCGQARALVASAGAIVLSTGQYTYDRFVVSGGFCMAGEYPKPTTAPTRDGYCSIGYVCKYEDRFLDFD